MGRHMHRIACFGLALAVLFGLHVMGYAGQEAHVRWVIDGDTIVLRDGRHVRYIGINSPETAKKGRPAEPYAHAARRLNHQLVHGRRVHLQFDQERRDHYGRRLAYVFMEDGRMVNDLMVQNGLAYCLYHHPNTKHHQRLLASQQAAMDAGVGLWQHLSSRAGRYIGNRRSKRFHAATCRFGKRIRRRYRVLFNDARHAFYNGYAPDRHCLPGLPLNQNGLMAD